jgi:DNA-binding transcriptional ArsR family regulator
MAQKRQSYRDPIAAGELQMFKAQFFRALAHPTRIRILEILLRGGRTVQELQEELALDQPIVSQHLAVLRNQGVVRLRRKECRFDTRCAIRSCAICSTSRAESSTTAWTPRRGCSASSAGKGVDEFSSNRTGSLSVRRRLSSDGRAGSASLWSRHHVVDVVGEIAQPDRSRILRPIPFRRNRW